MGGPVLRHLTEDNYISNDSSYSGMVTKGWMGTEPTSCLLGAHRAKEEIDMEMASHGDTKEKKDTKHREQTEER